MPSEKTSTLTFSRVLMRSLCWYWPYHLAIAGSITLAIAVLVGSLAVGWSLQESLKKQLLSRLGEAQYAASPDYPISFASVRKTAATPALELRAVASNPENVATPTVPATLWAVDESFKAIAPAFPGLKQDEVAINQRLAEELHLQVGAWLVLRLDGSLLSPQSGLFTFRKSSDMTRTVRLKVNQILTPAQGGNFSLAQTQLAARNIFLSEATLSSVTGRPAIANHLLFTRSPDAKWPDHLAQAMTLEDLGISHLQTSEGDFLHNQRIVFSPAEIKAIRQMDPSCQLISTNLAEELQTNSGRVSYGLIAAAVGHELQEDQVILNEEVATDLHARVGDPVQMAVLLANRDGSYHSEKMNLKVQQILPMGQGLFVQAVTANIAGLSNASRIDNWNVPFPVDMKKVTSRDEQYWDNYRATPKAIVANSLLQKFWQQSDYVGGQAITAIYIAGKLPKYESGLVAQSVQEDASLHPQNVVAAATLAGQGSSDFASLFAAMSLFLILAAFIITLALTRLAVQKRTAELSLIWALGLRQRDWMRLLTIELTLAAIPGLLGGIGLGIAYAAALLHLFTQLSRGVWEIPPLSLHIQWFSLILAGVIIAVSMMALLTWQIYRRMRKAVVQTLWGESIAQVIPSQGGSWLAWGTGTCFLAGILVIALASRWGSNNAFFMSSMVLLAACYLGGMRVLRLQLARTGHLNLPRLVIRWMLADRHRVLLSYAIFLAASFILSSVALYRSAGVDVDMADPRGPTGGLAIRVSSPLAYRYDLSTPVGMKQMGLPEIPQAKMYSFAVSGGEEGGCLNLVLPDQMQLLGVPESFITANPQAFTIQLAKPQAGNPWLALTIQDQEALPVFGDADTMQWIAKHAVGDRFTMPVAGRLQQFYLAGVIPGGLFSGQLLIAQENYRRLFPADHGYRLHLVSCSPSQIDSVLAALKPLAELGMSVELTSSVVAAVQSVQQLYMSLFLVLGGLGLLLGAVGSGAMLLRDALIRKADMALLRALGLSSGQITLVFAATHILPILGGLLEGAVVAMVAYLAVSVHLAIWPVVLLMGSIGLIAMVICLVIGRNAIPRDPGESLRIANT